MSGNPNHDEAGRFSSGNYSNPKTMPNDIEGVSIDKKPIGGRMLAIGGTSGVRVNTSRDAMKIWNNIEAYMKKTHAEGYHSSDHPNHILWHELGHTLSKNNGSTDDESRLSNTNSLSNPSWHSVAGQVSKYAQRNGHEFLSEVYAAKRAGRKFSQDVENHYEMLGGSRLHAKMEKKQ